MSPDNLKKLNITQTPGINHQLELVWKSCQEFNKNKKIQKILWDFEIKADHLIPIHKTR